MAVQLSSSIQQIIGCVMKIRYNNALTAQGDNHKTNVFQINQTSHYARIRLFISLVYCTANTTFFVRDRSAAGRSFDYA